MKKLLMSLLFCFVLLFCSVLYAQTEIIEKRTYNSKTFRLAEKKKNLYATNFYSGHIHYKNRKRFEDIDFKLIWDDTKKGWYFNKHSFHPFLPEYADQWSEFRDVFKAKDQTTRMKAVCNHVKGKLINSEDFLKGIEGVLYENAFSDGVDLIYCFSRSSLRKLIRFRTYPSTDTHYDFEIDFPRKVYCEKKEIDLTRNHLFDKGKPLFIGGDNGTVIKKFLIWDSEGKTNIVNVDYFIQDGKKYLRKNIPADFFSDAQGNVFTDTTTSYYMGSGEDGLTTETNEATWDGAHDAAGDLHTGYDDRIIINDFAYVGIYRLHLPFNTSGLPDSATVTSATLYMYCNSVSIGDDDGDDLVAVVKSFMNDPTTLENADYVDCGETSGGGGGTAMNTPIVLASDDEKDASGESTGWWSWALNSYGLANISLTSYSLYGLREGHDYKDQAITASTENEISFNDSQDGSNNPYLSVTYTVPKSIYGGAKTAGKSGGKGGGKQN